VCVGERETLHVCVGVCERVRDFVCERDFACVCVCERERLCMCV